jgi:hypothetical protein
MKTNLNKITKIIAAGIFFMALFFNVKLSLEDPFVQLDNEAVAQTTSSSPNCTPGPKGCWNTISTRVGYPAMYCGSCTYVPNSEGAGGTATCSGC